MRLILMGTGAFAVPAFRRLFDSSHEIVALATRPVPPPREACDTEGRNRFVLK